MMKKNIYYIFIKLQYKHINCYYVLKVAVIDFVLLVYLYNIYLHIAYCV